MFPPPEAKADVGNNRHRLRPRASNTHRRGPSLGCWVKAQRSRSAPLRPAPKSASGAMRKTATAADDVSTKALRRPQVQSLNEATRRILPVDSMSNPWYSPTMNTTLRDFIAKRRSEIRSAIADLQRELLELDAAEAAANAAAHGVASAPVPRPHIFYGGGEALAPSKQPTIKDMVRDVLTGFPQGLDANDIINVVRDRFGVDVPRSSMSPQLSRLKSEGVIELDGKLWRLPQKTEAPNGSAAGASGVSREGSHPSSDMFSNPASDRR